MIRSLARPSTRTLVVPLLFFALLTAVTARVTIPLPFTAVPITLQTLAVLLSGLVLGGRAGAFSQLLYLAALLSGLPISATGLAGPLAFISPTAGYLVAFVPAAFVAGYMTAHWHTNFPHLLLLHIIAGLCGLLVIYVGGVAWLTVLLGNLHTTLQHGVYPFIAVDLGKAVAAALVAGGGRILLFPSSEQ